MARQIIKAILLAGLLLMLPALTRLDPQRARTIMAISLNETILYKDN